MPVAKAGKYASVHGGSHRYVRRGGRQQQSQQQQQQQQPQHRSRRRRDKPQQPADEFDGSSSSDSSGGYLHLGRINPQTQSRTRTAETDEASTAGEAANRDASNFSDISSGSDAILQKYESIMGRLPNPSGDRHRRRKALPQASDASMKNQMPSPSGDRHRRWKSSLSKRQQKQITGSGVKQQQQQQQQQQCCLSTRLCSRHRREMKMPAPPQPPSTPLVVGRGGCGGNGDGDGGGGQRLASPSGSFTRSGDPSSQIAYQAELSPVTTDSDDERTPTPTAASRRREIGGGGGGGGDRQLARLATLDANSSNRQQSIRRSGPSLHKQQQQQQQQQQEPPLQRRRGGSGPSRDRYSRVDSKCGDASVWDLSNESDIYDSGRRRSSRHGQSPRKCSAHGGSRQQPHQKQHHQSSSIYLGNHAESDVMERQKLSSLRRLHSLRNRRYDSSLDSDRDVPSPRPRQQSRQRRQQQLQQQRLLLLQQQQEQQQQQQQMQQQSPMLGATSRRKTRGGDKYNRQMIYGDGSEQRQCRPRRGERLACQPQPRSGAPDWQKAVSGGDDEYDHHNDDDDDNSSDGDSDGFASMDVLPPRSGDDDRFELDFDESDLRGSARTKPADRPARRSAQPGRQNRLGQYDKGDLYGKPVNRLGRPDKFDRLSKFDWPDIPLPDMPDTMNFIDRPNRFDKPGRFYKPDKFFKPNRFAKEEEEEEELRTGGGRQANAVVAAAAAASAANTAAPARRHWCDGGGRMRETWSRKDTIFSCPYVSLSLQAKTYECDRCAGNLPYTNNLNSNPNRPAHEATTTSPESIASPLRSGTRRSAAGGARNRNKLVDLGGGNSGDGGGGGSCRESSRRVDEPERRHRECRRRTGRGSYRTTADY